MSDQQPQKPAVVLRPTVIIGLGGSGYEIVLNLKRAFVEAFGKVPQIISFRVFDTAESQNISRKLEDGTEITVTAGEFIRVGVANAHRVVELNDNIKAWFPPNISREAVVAGAGQIRARGRLA